jgi:hypothetical protein
LPQSLVAPPRLCCSTVDSSFVFLGSAPEPISLFTEYQKRKARTRAMSLACQLREKVPLNAWAHIGGSICFIFVFTSGSSCDDELQLGFQFLFIQIMQQLSSESDGECAALF